MEGLLIPFITILAAEFLDKSQLSLILLSTRTKNHIQLFLGAMLGFLIVDGLAILFGSWITTLIDENYLKIIGAIVFIVFGLLNLKGQNSEKKPKNIMTHAFSGGLFAIFLTEWADKTQIATALFATKYNPVLVFIGVIIALAILSILAIGLGKTIEKHFDKNNVQKVAGAIFILLGVIFLFS